MSEQKSYKWAYRRRTWSFSLSCIAVVLLGGVFTANHRNWGVQINDAPLLVVGVGAVLIYLLKRLIWRCPACGHSFEMGTTSYQGAKSSRKDNCPSCKVSFR
ncbi:hypothetical protein FQZ97_1099950 [compost metagenome]